MATTQQKNDALIDDATALAEGGHLDGTALVTATLAAAPAAETLGLAQATAEAAVNAVDDADKAGFAEATTKAAVDAAPTGEKTAVAQAAAQAAVAAAPVDQRAAVAQTAIDGVPQQDLKAVAQAAVDGLTVKDRKALAQESFPQDSDDRKMVFLVGFLVSGAVVVALSWIAASVDADKESTSTAILLLGTAFTSAMLGGLLGVYKGGG